MPFRVLDFTGQQAPKPTPGWVNAMAKVFSVVFGVEGTQPVPTVPNGSATTETNGTAEASVDLTQLWRIYTDRKRVIKDIDNMDRNDEIIQSALDIIADHTTAFDDQVNYRLGEKPGDVKKVNQGFEKGFRVTANDPEVQAVINKLVLRLDLQAEIWQIVRRFVKYGTYLPEIILDKDKKLIIGLNETPAHEVWPMINEKGHKIPGWIYRRDRDVFTSSTGSVESGTLSAGVEMAEWQILPFFFGAKQGFFTMPMLGSMMYNWKRLQKLEDNMAVQRIRATDRYVHMIPVGDNMSPDEVKASIRNYKQAATKREVVGFNNTISAYDSPLDAYTEYFLPQFKDNPGKIEVLNPSNAHLGNLTDIYYSRERILARLGVPITYLQIMSTQKTHLTAQAGVSGVEKQFAKFIRRCQETLRRGLSRLIDLQLVLAGIAPLPGMYVIELPEITTKDAMNDAKVNLANAQAAVYFTEAFGALPLELLGEVFLTLTPEQQNILRAFISKSGDTIVKAKIDALKLAATAPVPGGGGEQPLGVAKAKQRVTGVKKGGNSGKSLAERSSEQKGAAVQSVPLAEAVNLFMAIKENVENAMLTQGLDVSAFQSAFSVDRVEAELADIAFWGEESEG